MDGRAWQVLRDLEAWQVTQIPRRPHARQDSAGGQDQADLGTAQRLQALVSAFHYGAPVAFGWIREQPGGPVRVLAAGPALTGGADGGQAVLTFPAGARARAAPARPGRGPAGADAVLDAAGRHHRCPAGRPRRARSRTARDARPSLEDGLLSAWSGPFAWLVLAEPVPAGQLGELADEVSLAQLGAQRSTARGPSWPRSGCPPGTPSCARPPRPACGRSASLAGGPAPSAAAQVAGLLCASADLDGLPYALAPVAGCAGLEEILDRRPGQSVPTPCPPSRGTPGMDRRAVPVPRARTRDDRISRLRPRRFTPRPGWWPRWPGPRPGRCPASGSCCGPTSTSPRKPGPSRCRMGRGSPRRPGGAGGNRAGLEPGSRRGLAVPRASLNRHTFVCGATGAGKSQTVRGLLEAATRAGIPWLVVEPAKAEYRLMAARLPGTEVIRIRPGELGDPPAGINPLEPAPGPDGTRFPLQTHADLVRALFLAAFEADEPFPQVLAAALTRCYEDAGWDLVTGEPASPRPGAGLPGAGGPAGHRAAGGRGDRLRPGDHRQRPRVRHGADLQPAAGHHRPVPPRRPPAGLHPAAGAQRGVGDRRHRR